MDLNPIDEAKKLIEKAKLEMRLDFLRILMDLFTNGEQVINQSLLGLIEDTKKKINN